MSAHALVMAVPLPIRISEMSIGERRTMEVASGEPPGMDEQAFRGLYTRTARPLRAYLGRVVGNSALADDLLQETYYRFLRVRLDSDDEAYQKNYLFRIATNLMRDHFRRPKVEVKDDADHPAEARFGEEVAMRSDVGGALAELSPRDRAMLWLAYVEGATHEEIGSALGLKPRSIRSMLFRARSRIASLLRARGLGEPGRTVGAP